MSTALSMQTVADRPKQSVIFAHGEPLMQSQHACGSRSSSLNGQSKECIGGKRILQAKLTIGASNDPLEHEADRIADQVMTATVKPAEGATPCRIQRMSGQSYGQMETAPDSVNRVLASSGRPLEPGLREDMEQRFGYDFSSVRVHTNTADQLSARDVNASAYTVGQHLVFDSGRFIPKTYEGRRLIAHELTHVVQQSGTDRTRISKTDRNCGPSTTSLHDSPVDNGVLQRDENEELRKVKARMDAFPPMEFHPSWGLPRPVPDTAAANGTSQREQSNSHTRPPGMGPKLKSRTPEEQIEDFNVDPHKARKAKTSNMANSVAAMSTTDKVGQAMRRSVSKMPRQGWDRLKELITPEAITVMALFTTVYVVSQLTPVGWFADILVAGLIAATVLMLGQEVIEIVKLLMAFVSKATDAKSEADLDEAAELFAQAVSKAGVDIIIAILFHKAGKAANLKPPGPRSPGLAEVIQRGGGKIIVNLLEPAKGGYKVTPSGEVSWVPDTGALMMEGQGGAGGPKGGGAGKAPVGKAAVPEVPHELPGKNLVAADALAKKKPQSPNQLAAEAHKLKTGDEPAPARKETGAQQERRMLSQDRASGRPANSPAYHAYEGGSRGSFNSWLKALNKHIQSTSKGEPAAPKLNESPLLEKTHAYIDRHPNLKAAWEKMNLAIDTRLKEIQRLKSAAAGDKVRIRELARTETTLEVRRADLSNFETGEVGVKRPDLVETFPAERRAVVTDITQATGDTLHNFKTEFYVEVVKEVLGWDEVNGVNFNSVYDQNIVQ